MNLKWVLMTAVACTLFVDGRQLCAQPEAVRADDGKVRMRGQTFEIYPYEKLREHGFEPPDIPDESNAAWVYLQAINAKSPVPEGLNEAYLAAAAGTWPKGEAGDRLKAWLEENRPALDLIRRASTMPDYYMPFFRGDSDMMLFALMPTLSDTRDLVRMLSADSVLRMAEGDGEAAVGNLLAAKRIGNQVGHGQTVLEGLVGVACGALADQGLLRLAESGGLDSETLKGAIAELDRLRVDSPTFEHMARGEGVWAASFVDDVIDLPGGFSALTGGDVVNPPEDGWSRLRSALRRVYLPDRAMKRHLSDHFDRMIEAAREENAPFYKGMDEVDELAHIPAWDVVTRVVMPSLSRVHELTVRGRSNSLRTALRLATEAYRMDKGVYPPTLESLVPDYLSEAPPDPMTCGAFEYLANGPGGRPAGLEQITRDNEAAYKKKRAAPNESALRASKWRQYVTKYAESHRFTEAQQASAEAILKELEGRAAFFERAKGKEIRELFDKGEIEAAKKRMAPVNGLFEELQRRIESLSTAEQRRAEKPKQ